MFFVLHKDSDFVSKNHHRRDVFLEIHRQAHVKLATCQVVGHRILDAVHVGNPIVAAHIADVEQVEHVESKPNALKVAQEA